MDERVLISTIGSRHGQHGQCAVSVRPVRYGLERAVSRTGDARGSAFAEPARPEREAVSGRAQPAASQPRRQPDLGVNLQSTTLRSVFVYEVSSGTVLRSRLVANPSGVLAVRSGRFEVHVGIHAVRHWPVCRCWRRRTWPTRPTYCRPMRTSTRETNQGGSVFAPDGSVLYAAFDMSPQTSPATRPISASSCSTIQIIC